MPKDIQQQFAEIREAGYPAAIISRPDGAIITITLAEFPHKDFVTAQVQWLCSLQYPYHAPHLHVTVQQLSSHGELDSSPLPIRVSSLEQWDATTTLLDLTRTVEAQLQAGMPLADAAEQGWEVQKVVTAMQVDADEIQSTEQREMRTSVSLLRSEAAKEVETSYHEVPAAPAHLSSVLAPARPPAAPAPLSNRGDMRWLFIGGGVGVMIGVVLLLFLTFNTAVQQQAQQAQQARRILPEVDPATLSGNIRIAGSSTVFPLAERIANEFIDEGFRGQLSINSIGSGTGLERFCVAAETDIANSSRAINDEEIAACQSNGRDPIEFLLGLDGLAVVVSAQNDFVTEMTLEEVALAFSTAELWSDIRPEWPAERIQRFSPGTDSGTFDFFIEEVFAKDTEPLLTSSNLQLSEDDNVLVQGVESSPFAIAYFGYAYYIEEADRLTILDIDGVEATPENVENGSYPLARPLFMYSTAEIMQEKPQVAGFLNYALTNVTSLITDVGYFPVSDEELEDSRQRWLAAMGLGDPPANGLTIAEERGLRWK